MNLCSICANKNCNVKCGDLEPCLTCSKFIQEKENNYQSKLVKMEV